MSLLAEILISHIIKNRGNNSIKILGHALTYVLASMAQLFNVENDSIAFSFTLLSYIVMSIFCIHLTKLTYEIYH